jgi:hypothetical protein
VYAGNIDRDVSARLGDKLEEHEQDRDRTRAAGDQPDPEREFDVRYEQVDDQAASAISASSATTFAAEPECHPLSLALTLWLTVAILIVKLAEYQSRNTLISSTNVPPAETHTAVETFDRSTLDAGLVDGPAGAGDSPSSPPSSC